MKELDLNENSSKSLLTIVLDMADDFNFDDNDDGSWWWHEWYCFQNKMKELDLKEKSSKSLLANVLDMDDDYRPSSTLPQVFPQHHHDQHQQHHHDQHQHQHQHLIMMNILSIQASITQATPARIRMVASSGNLTHHLYKKNIFYRLLPPLSYHTVSKKLPASVTFWHISEIAFSNFSYKMHYAHFSPGKNVNIWAGSLEF